jgi:anti-sigma B factor antagonist
MTPYRRLAIREAGDITVVTFRDHRLDHLPEITELGQELIRLVDEGRHRKLVLNLAGVELMSSIVLCKLISLCARVKSSNGIVKLCNLEPQVLEVIQMCKLDRIFDIAQDETEAELSFPRL